MFCFTVLFVKKPLSVFCGFEQTTFDGIVYKDTVPATLIGSVWHAGTYCMECREDFTPTTCMFKKKLLDVQQKGARCDVTQLLHVCFCDGCVLE